MPSPPPSPPTPSVDMESEGGLAPISEAMTPCGSLTNSHAPSSRRLLRDSSGSMAFPSSVGAMVANGPASGPSSSGGYTAEAAGGVAVAAGAVAARLGGGASQSGNGQRVWQRPPQLFIPSDPLAVVVPLRDMKGAKASGTQWFF